ncbi:MAG: hypothetical protein KC994_25515, partial [Candidatus Omnitrophica bacterium]|nr:hypothetical protein [Candidatus Omnitrophota bacterium]
MKYKLAILLVLTVGLGLSFGIHSFENGISAQLPSQSEIVSRNIDDSDGELPWRPVPTSQPIRLAQALVSDAEVIDSPTPTPLPPKTFTIEKIEPLPEEKTVLITFSEEVDMDELRNRGDVEPYANLRWWNSSVQGRVLRLKGRFDYGRDYEISFPQKVTSRSGKTYRPTLVKFHMPDRPQALEFTEKKTLIERNSRQMIHLDVVNIDEIQFEGIQVPPMALPLARSMVK